MKNFFNKPTVIIPQMLLCNKKIIRIFSFGSFKALIFLNRWWYQLHHIRVNTHIISMPENTHDKLSKTKNFVSKIFLYLSFLTAIRGKIKGWVLQKWPFGCWLEVTVVKMFCCKSITSKQPGKYLNERWLKVAVVQRWPLVKVLLYLHVHNN